MALASEGSNSPRMTVRLHRPLAASISSKSGAYRSTVPPKNALRRLSAPELPLSGRNHLRATLASTTWFRIGGLSLHESIRNCPSARPPALESAHAGGGSVQAGPGCDLRAWPLSFCRSWLASLLCALRFAFHSYE